MSAEDVQALIDRRRVHADGSVYYAEAANQTARLALTGLSAGAEVYQIDNSTLYKLIDEDNISDPDSWTTPSGGASPGSRGLQNNSDALILTPATAAQITANKNNWNPGTQKGFINISADTGGWAVTGIVFDTPAVDGEQHVLNNAGNWPILFVRESASSTAANRLYTSTAANLFLPPGGLMVISYSAALSRWQISTPLFYIGTALPGSGKFACFDSAGRIIDLDIDQDSFATNDDISALSQAIADISAGDTYVVKTNPTTRTLATRTDIDTDEDGQPLLFSVPSGGGRYWFSIRAWIDARTGGILVAPFMAAGVTRIQAQTKIFKDNEIVAGGLVEAVSTDGTDGDQIGIAGTGKYFVEMDGYFVTEAAGDFGLGWGQFIIDAQPTSLQMESVLTYKKTGDV